MPSSERTAVYRFFNGDGTLIYVGVTNDIPTRWRHHAKNKPWWPEVVEQRATWYPTREAALAVEDQVIVAESPTYNINSSPGQGPTPIRMIRMSDELWEAFGEVCKAMGTTRSRKLREHMRAHIAEMEADKRQVATELAEISALGARETAES